MRGPYTGRRLKGAWRLGNLIGSGACAQIYAVSDERPEAAATATRWAAKVCPLPPPQPLSKKRRKSDAEKNADLLYYENILYNGALRGHPLVPTVPFGRGFGDDDGGGGSAERIRFVVMQRMGPNLQEAFEAAGGLFSPREVASLGLGMLTALRVLHEAHRMVFVDVKPQNFVLPAAGDRIGASARPAGPLEILSGVPVTKVYLLDFGLSECFVSAGGTAHRPFKQHASPAGTPEFLSLSCHGGGSAGRSDDLEAVGYVLWHFLAGGRLPWSAARSDKDGRSLKQAATAPPAAATATSGRGPPAPELGEWVALARATAFDGKPDYDAFAALLVKLARRGGTVGGGNNGNSGSSRGCTAARGAAAACGVRGDADGCDRRDSGRGARALRRSGGGAAGDGGDASVPPGAAAVAAAAVPVDLTSDDEEGAQVAPARRAAAHGESKENAGVAMKRPVGKDRDTAGPKARSVRQRSCPNEGDGPGGPMIAAVVAAVKDPKKIKALVAAAGAGTGPAAAAEAGATVVPMAGAGATAAGGFVLEAVSGPHKGWAYEMLAAAGRPARGGRSKKHLIDLHKDEEVSETHFSLEVWGAQPGSGGSGDGPSLVVSDLESTNGTFLNGERLESRRVRCVCGGDVIRVGGTELAVHAMP